MVLRADEWHRVTACALVRLEGRIGPVLRGRGDSDSSPARAVAWGSPRDEFAPHVAHGDATLPFDCVQPRGQQRGGAVGAVPEALTHEEPRKVLAGSDPLRTPRVAEALT